MSLFQTTVISKYLKTQDKNLLQEKWIQFQNHFHNATIQDNIRNSKEEQYQGEFLLDLFVAILGYTKNPQPNFNLTTEYKNVKDSKKADGAIVINEKVIAVIELKGTETTDLGKIESQAFGYKNNQPDCNYIITSNFEKIRFYIDNAIEYIEFNLFKLKKSEFDVLYLILGCNNLANHLAKRIKEESLSQEDQITKSLYKDYSLFKRELFHNLVANNTQFEPIDLFKKSQKLLDRFLFLFFAEDRHLLPPNSVRLVLSDWRDLQDRDVDIPLYDRFKKYFEYLNTGYKGKRYDVYAYNGGLFKPDEILDHITIDNDLLYKHALKLSDYDFASEVDVNILGHIFENSLNELDEMKAQLEGQEIDKSKTKRKKDGVFYTPKYITKYIVENTVGKLCNEKKNELQLLDEDYTTDKKRQKKTVQQLNERLQTYRNWLLQITICDPACGSGAFLNQALDFLINEHAYIDELQAKLFGDAMILSDVEKSILENNLFGVDLNEESVEIAKLSLWLRTAQPNRKLNDLSGNIKCGNSLIDDPEVAGDKAFNWKDAFPQVFAKGGFDVIIGNPPYVRSRGLFLENEKNYFTRNFETSTYQLDLYKLFIEKSCKLLSSKGLLSFITPSVFLINDYDKPLRKFLLDNYSILLIANTDENIFDDASVKTAVFVIENTFEIKNLIEFLNISKSQFFTEKLIEQKVFVEQEYLINEKLSVDSISIIEKLNLIKKLNEFYEVKNGMKVRKELLFNSKHDDFHMPFILGKNINSYFLTFDNVYVDYKLENEKLYTNQAFRDKSIFIAEKLVVRQILGKRIVTCYDDFNYFTDQTTYLILKNNTKKSLKYLLAILNSKLMFYYFSKTTSDNKIVFPKIKKSQLLELPIAFENQSNNIIEDLSCKMIYLFKQLIEQSTKFQRTFQRKFEGIEINKKLESWYELTFADFVKELGKKKIKLSLSEESEWEDYFLQEQQKAVAIKNEIDATDKEIDRMVYELYGLSEEEIKIVENS
ncbi:BREX-1 system adenine-specific DNA-methyltransferase PglX [Flavobacterium azooxidireducens]|uniref:site-specific DNA-methyltransferase (adenine-specific) n=1 Tax=Flavobacterium azooxidireducens TaxID=1871076 RepID=A0ABY4KAC4_9FLAO|nr:TaqI-like C-terminal specificity domain-containing protein [Flavobacterium azooxidireducens]UPQ77748.1 BREX-1 system adenine-specific DNA-methyltransferase PglX [Flavobacterium azooxidireducens]